jgi:hypothetical protein
MISIQDGVVFSIGVWISGEYGGHQENPANSAALIREAETILRQPKPHLSRRKNKVSLVWPLGIAQRMRWPKDGRPRVPGDAEP